jgi:hypothetical protein
MIQAYIDESGTHDQATIIVAAGFLSSFKRWRKFEKLWDAILNPDGGKRVFHATDCLGKDGYGDFEGWPKDDRNQLVDKLIPVAREKTLFCFSSAFSLKDYEEIVPEGIKRKWKHPAHRRTLQLLRELIRHREFNLEPHFLNRKALQEFVRIFKETHAEVGEWEWNS